MGIRCIGFEVVCNNCLVVKLGPFDTFEDAERGVCEADWSYWLPSFETECPQCAAKKSEAAR
jgi:hypothetical protein